MEQIIQKGIEAILPVYIKDRGNCTRIYTREDEIVLDKTIKTIIEVTAISKSAACFFFFLLFLLIKPKIINNAKNAKIIIFNIFNKILIIHFNPAKTAPKKYNNISSLNKVY